jgi:hypothetical protein
MSTIGKLSVTALLAWILIVGPLLTISAGISLITSLPTLTSTLARQLISTDKEKSAKTAELVEPLRTKQESTGTERQLEILGATLAVLRPVPALVPAGETALAYVREAIVWQFESGACRTVVGIKYVTSGIVVAECDTSEKFLLIATAVTGQRSVLRCAALPDAMAAAAPGCR